MIKEFLFFAVLIAHAVSIDAQQLNDTVTLSPFFWINGTGVEKLPLNATYASVSVRGVIAQVKITQLYQNRGSKTIEAIYIFPASTRATVYGMQMYVGGRVVVGKILTKFEARQQYENAIKDGKTASLLEMQRPNVFSMSVGNILPGDIIRVEIFYTELLVPVDNVYSFHYPATMVPRYTSIGETPMPQPQYGDAGDGETYTFGFDMTLYAGMEVSNISSDTHKFDIIAVSPQFYQLSLSANETKPGTKDILIQYTLSGDSILTGILTFDGEKDDGFGGPFRLIDSTDGKSQEITWDIDPVQNENFFLVMIQPPALSKIGESSTREYIFILDVSGSMYGFPNDLSRDIMQRLIQSLRTDRDYFNILAFAGGSTLYKPQSVLASNSSLNEGINFVNSFGGSGGTEMLDAIKRGLALPAIDDARGVSRTYVILTDGGVSLEPTIFQLIIDNLQTSNFFAFSIGSSPNRYLTQGIAKVGRGEEFWVKDETDASTMVPRFISIANYPILTSVKVEFSPSWDVYDVNPVPGILLAQRPIIVNGKWRGVLPDGQLLAVSGIKSDGSLWNQTVKSSNNSNSLSPRDTRALRYLWAGATIDDARYGSENATVANNTILPIALKYSILTEYSSFLAVDTEVRSNVTVADITKVTQTLPLPQGVSNYAKSGETDFSQGNQNMGDQYGSKASVNHWSIYVLFMVIVLTAISH